MLNCRPAGQAAWLVALVAALPVCLAGCRSERAAATSDGPSVSGTPNPAGATARDQPAAQPRPKLPPGAKTVAQERAGDRPYERRCRGPAGALAVNRTGMASGPEMKFDAR